MFNTIAEVRRMQQQLGIAKFNEKLSERMHEQREIKYQMKAYRTALREISDMWNIEDIHVLCDKMLVIGEDDAEI